MTKEQYTPTVKEQETHISFCATGDKARIYTTMPKVMHKLDRMVERFPNEYKIIKSDENYGAKIYEVDYKYIRFGTVMSAENREARSEGLRKRREESKSV